MSYLSPRVRQVTALGILAFLVILAWSLICRPLYSATADAVEALRDANFDLQRAHRVVAERNAVSETAIAAQEMTLSQYLQPGNSFSNAIVSMQGAASQLVKDSGLTLESMSAEPAQMQGNLYKLVVVMKVRGTEISVVKMLDAVSARTPLLAVDRVEISSPEATQPAATGASGDLVMEVRIVGYWADRQSGAGVK